MLIAINYHYIRHSFGAPYEGIYGVTPAQLESQLKMLGSVGEFVGPDQVRAAVRGDVRLPEKSILVTFDDGLKEQYENAWPILRRLGIPAIFFVNTAPIMSGKVLLVHKIHLLRSNIAPEEFVQRLARHAAEHNINLDVRSESDEALKHYSYDPPEVARLKYFLNFRLKPNERDTLVELLFAEAFPGREREICEELYTTRSQIEELASFGFIGSHSHEHFPLGLLSDEQAEEQIMLAQTCLSEWAGYLPFALSYPYGSRDACPQRVGSIAAKLGIDFALTIEKAVNHDFAQPFQLARFDCNDLPGGKAPLWQLNNLFEAAPSACWYS